MKEDLREKLVTYYYDALLNAYIYSDDLKSFIEKRNIVNEDWFLGFLDANIEYNKENNIFGVNERENCYCMLNDLLINSIENKNIDTVNKCNELIVKLNCSDYENECEYLQQLYISNSPNTKKATKLIENDLIDLDTVKKYFYYAANFALYLLQQQNDDDEIAIELLNNEFVVFSIISWPKAPYNLVPGSIKVSVPIPATLSFT